MRGCAGPSLSGAREDIFREAQRLYAALGQESGGFIGYVEQYENIGLSAESYQACCDAFAIDLRAARS